MKIIWNNTPTVLLSLMKILKSDKSDSDKYENKFYVCKNPETKQIHKTPRNAAFYSTKKTNIKMFYERINSKF